MSGDRKQVARVQTVLVVQSSQPVPNAKQLMHASAEQLGLQEHGTPCKAKDRTQTGSCRDLSCWSGWHSGEVSTESRAEAAPEVADN